MTPDPLNERRAPCKEWRIFEVIMDGEVRATVMIDAETMKFDETGCLDIEGFGGKPTLMLDWCGPAPDEFREVQLRAKESEPSADPLNEKLREAIADLHARARKKAENYVRSSRLWPQYKAKEVAYETVLKLIDAESNRIALAAHSAAPSEREPAVKLRRTVEAEHTKAKKLWRTLKPGADAARYQYWAGFCDAMAFCGAEIRESIAPDDLMDAALSQDKPTVPK